VKTESTGFTPKTSQFQKVADRTSSATVTERSSGFELETRSSATDQGDSGGGWSLSVGAMRHESLLLSASVRSESGSPNLASFEAHGVAFADDTRNRRQERSSAEVDMWDSVSCLGKIYSKSPSVFGAVNLEHVGTPTLSQRTGA
jgi:hypothetical protein